ncbi:abscisic stress-ripening protein 5-like [Cryptomeria japonica]|uniref:abscisic stress-ripening protein 5-like n=1 Tax=Cryptomeria japonica TaxID=3369 RepID=UPI0027DA8A3B|nr:abscisic stress-ripening protein 5-like [Cryptomeria japonica]
MSEEHQHHLFHHKKDEEVRGDADNSAYVEQTTGEYGGEDKYEKARKEEKHHKHLEEGGELGTGAAGGFAMYEKHEAKKDPENAHRHKIEEEIAAAAAVGGGGAVFHEHHEKKEDKKEEEEAHGKKHHHFF